MVGVIQPRVIITRDLACGDCRAHLGILKNKHGVLVDGRNMGILSVIGLGIVGQEGGQACVVAGVLFECQWVLLERSGQLSHHRIMKLPKSISPGMVNHRRILT
jgi:hypothetical protein